MVGGVLGENWSGRGHTERSAAWCAATGVMDNGITEYARSARYIKDRAAFVFECCQTYDETDVSLENIAAMKRMPRLPHIEQVVYYWERARLLALPKSRRMLVTWTLCCLDLHLAMYTPHAVIFIISSDQSKSDKLVSRIKFLYDHLPSFLVKPRAESRMGKSGDITRLDFVETESRIEALPQDPDKIRQEGATLLHIEEIAFWEWPEEAYKAMLPTIQGGGRMVIASSAKPNSFFEKIVRDQLGEAVKRSAG